MSLSINRFSLRRAHNLRRMPAHLRDRLKPELVTPKPSKDALRVNSIYHGDARQLLPRVAKNSVAVSVWSPPYFVGKNYEAHLSFGDWQELLRSVIALHYPIIKPGGFLAINIADILCFKDDSMPRVQAEAVDRRRSQVTREDVLNALAKKSRIESLSTRRIAPL